MQHTTCPTCRTQFIAAPEGGAARAGAPVFEMPPDAASLDAFLDSEVTRAFETFLQGPRRPPGGNRNQSDPAGARDDAQPGRRDQEEYQEVHFEYNHDRSDFAGMYS